MPHEGEVERVSGNGQRPLIDIVTGDLQTDLTLIVKPPGYHTINLKLMRGTQIKKKSSFLAITIVS